MKKPELIYPAFVYSFNHESDAEIDRAHCCGKKQGAEPACRIKSSFHGQYTVGDQIIQNGFSSPPAVGRRVYTVTHVDKTGTWGVLIEDTVRVLDPEEVR